MDGKICPPIALLIGPYYSKGVPDPSYIAREPGLTKHHVALFLAKAFLASSFSRSSSHWKCRGGCPRLLAEQSTFAGSMLKARKLVP